MTKPIVPVGDVFLVRLKKRKSAFSFSENVKTSSENNV